MALVGLLAAEGVPNEEELFTVVALAIVVTLALQSTTKAWLARRLGLIEEPVRETPEVPTARPGSPPGSRARV